MMNCSAVSYQTFKGQSGNLEVDLNFMFREPLWDFQVLDSHLLGSFQARSIPVLDVHELAAGKLAALFARHQARDLFDSHLLLNTELDQKRLRIAFVVYGALNRNDWRKISLDDIAFDPTELGQMLVPVLQRKTFEKREEVAGFAQRLVTECKEKLAIVFPFTPEEREFLDRILSQGEIEPSRLTPDPILQDRIKRHPMLNWKAMNVRQHFQK